MSANWNNELKKLKKDAHWYIDHAFPSRADAYTFIRSYTGKCHVSEMNKLELEVIIRKMKKQGRKRYE